MKKILSEVTGSVWKVMAQPGQALQAGDTILVVESMKMEIPVTCEQAGTLREVFVAESEMVQEGQWLATLD
jgi:biotin carboxyl carrier protein